MINDNRYMILPKTNITKKLPLKRVAFYIVFGRMVIF